MCINPIAALGASGEFIGHLGLSPCSGEVEIGYAIEEAQQGRGLATEAVRAAVEWAIPAFDLPRVLGIVARDNVASCRVLHSSSDPCAVLWSSIASVHADRPGEHMTPDPQLVSLLQRARHVLIFTGAGISTASGIPDYRGPQGIWKQRQPVYYEDFMTSEEARIEYWEFKLEGWAAFRDAAPNATHHAVAELERAGKLELVVTQNIDSLHLLAGTSPGKLVELHGTDRAVACQSCHERGDPAAHYEAFARTRRPPTCAACGGLLKPATISFGQQLRQEDLDRAIRGARAADLVISLGSTLAVTPAADIPLLAAQGGAPYAIINRGETAHDHHPAVTLRLDGDVVELFPAAVAAVCGDR